MSLFSASMPNFMTETNRFDPAEIVGGQPAPSAIPWQVSVQRGDYQSGYVHFCGATILDEFTLISAAHCFDDEMENTSKVIRAGSTKKSSEGQVYRFEISYNIIIFLTDFPQKIIGTN